MLLLRHVRFLRWLLASALLLWLAAPYWPGTVDDVYITVGFARTWAETGALTWTDGVRVEGYSNFLLVALLAACIRAGLDAAISAQLLALASGLGILGLMSWKLPRSTAGTIALLALAVWSPLCRWSVIGMETTLYALLLSAGWMAAVGSKQRFGVAIALLSLASVTRPEGAAYIGLALLLRVTMSRRWNAQDTLAAGSLLALAGYHGARAWWFGTLVPTPVLVKISGQPWIWHGVPQTAADLVLAAGLLLATGLATQSSRRTLLLAFVPIALQSAVLIRAGGDWMVYSRLMMPGIVATAMSLSSTARTTARPPAPIWLLVFAGAVLGGGWSSTGYGRFTLERRPLSELLRSSAAYTRGLDTPLAEDVAWAANNLPAGTSFLAVDAGMLSNIPGLHLIDMRGLVYRPVASAIAEHGAEHGLRNFLASSEAPGIVRVASWGPSFPELPGWLVREPERFASLKYGGGEIRWFTPPLPPVEAQVRHQRWETLLQRFPSHPYLHWQAALAHADIDDAQRGLSILQAASERWGRDARFQGDLRCLSFTRSTHPLECEGTRGHYLPPEALLTSRPHSLGRLHVWISPPEATASLRISSQSGCRAPIDVDVHHGEAVDLSALSCSQRERVTVERLPDPSAVMAWAWLDAR